jgi:hypothetical protein
MIRQMSIRSRLLTSMSHRLDSRASINRSIWLENGLPIAWFQ